MRLLLDLKEVLRRLWPRPDPLRALLKDRLRQLRERAAREPDEVATREVVALWRALKAEEMSRRLPPGLILSVASVLVLVVAILALTKPAVANLEVTGAATGFSFELDAAPPAPLFPEYQPLVHLKAGGFDRLVVDEHREIDSTYVTVGPEGEAQLLSPLTGSPSTLVRLHQPARGVLAMSLERGEPMTISVTHPHAVGAEDSLDDLTSPALLELVPAAGEALDLELELPLEEAGDSGLYREVTLAQRVPVRSLRFEATTIDHDNPQLSRTVGTLRQASLTFPDLSAATDSLGQGARLQLEEAEGVLEYWLNEQGYLGFRYEGRVGKANVRTRGAEKDHDLFPSRLAMLRKEREAGLVASSAFLVIAVITALLQLRRLL